MGDRSPSRPRPTEGRVMKQMGSCRRRWATDDGYEYGLNEQDRQSRNCDGNGNSALTRDRQKNEIKRDEKGHCLEGGQSRTGQGKTALRKKFDGAVSEEKDNQSGRDSARMEPPSEKKSDSESGVVEEVGHQSRIPKCSALDNGGCDAQ